MKRMDFLVLALTLLLAIECQEHGFTDPRFLTFRQAKAAGGSVRRGERGSFVVFWKMLKTEAKDANGADKIKTIPMLRHFHVFNIEQCDGVELDSARWCAGSRRKSRSSPTC